MEIVSSFEMLVNTYKSKYFHCPEYYNLNFYGCKNFKSHETKKSFYSFLFLWYERTEQKILQQP
jgi:hypothetical protein